MVVVVGKEPAIFFFPFLIQEPFADAKRFQERAPQASQRTTHPHTHTTKKKKKIQFNRSEFSPSKDWGGVACLPVAVRAAVRSIRPCCSFLRASFVFPARHASRPVAARHSNAPAAGLSAMFSVYTVPIHCLSAMQFSSPKAHQESRTRATSQCKLQS